MKPSEVVDHVTPHKVAPRTGAWIETMPILLVLPWPKCRPPHGGVD